MPASPSVVAALVGVVVVALVGWLITAQRARRRAADAALEALGFHPCPDKKAWLDETVTSLEGNPRVRCEVGAPRRRAGEAEVYLYTKARRGQGQSQTQMAEQHEILFPLKRPSAKGVALMVKPSALKSGLATQLIELAATGPWVSQLEGLEKIELPVDLLESNVVLALGPRAGLLYDLIDARTVALLKTLGDCGAMFIQCRDGWCSIGSGGGQTPFDVAEILTRLGPLLR